MNRAEWWFAPERFRTWMWVRVVFCVGICAAVVALLGFGAGEEVHVQHGPDIVLKAGWLWLVPTGIYFFAARSVFSALFVGLNFFVGAFLALRAIYTDVSSTSAIGLLTFPIGFTVAVLAYFALEQLLFNLVDDYRRDQRRSEQ